MSILNNAIESIQIGMEDYHTIDQDKRRVLSAIRNLYSGILLLFKYKLQQLSPVDTDEVLLKTKIRPNIDPVKGIVWTGIGKKTVDVHDIKERLTSLGITNINWVQLNSLQGLRNNIEHYYSQEPLATMQKAITDSGFVAQIKCRP